jgi:hypothetical protein
MGRNFATELASSDTDLEYQIKLHLRHNHYPMVPVSMVNPCIYAIEAYNEECYNRMIQLPSGVLWRGQSSAPAHAIVEGYHLGPWLLQE